MEESSISSLDIVQYKLRKLNPTINYIYFNMWCCMIKEKSVEIEWRLKNKLFFIRNNNSLENFVEYFLENQIS